MTKLLREGPKKKTLETGHPPYLKVWIRNWFVPLEHSLSSLGLGANHLDHPGAFLERMGFGLI